MPELPNDWLWRATAWIMTTIAMLASGACAWMARQYIRDRPMLLRHEREINDIRNQMAQEVSEIKSDMRDLEVEQRQITRLATETARDIKWMCRVMGKDNGE